MERVDVLCREEGCNGKHYAWGYCNKHYRRMARHGHTGLVKPAYPSRICRAKGCTNERRKGGGNKGYCVTHYKRVYRTGQVADMYGIIDIGPRRLMNKRWKGVELRIAKLLGGVRAGAVGREGPDVLHPTLAPEIKTREKLPKWLTDAMTQAEDNAPEGKLPFIILHEKNWPMEKSIVGMRLGVMLELLRRDNA